MLLRPAPPTSMPTEPHADDRTWRLMLGGQGLDKAALRPSEVDVVRRVSARPEQGQPGSGSGAILTVDSRQAEG